MKPTSPTTAKTRPTPWANRGGAASSSSVGGASRGRIEVRNTQASGVRCTPNAAPAAKSAACTPSRPVAKALGAASRTTASTTAVTAAVKRGPRGSIETRADAVCCKLMGSPLSWRGWGWARARSSHEGLLE